MSLEIFIYAISILSELYVFFAQSA